MSSVSFVQELPASPEINSPNHELADFLYHSFYFSQGSTMLQYCLLTYGHAYYSEQIASLTDEDREQIRTTLSQRARAWITRGPHKDIEEDSPGGSTLDYELKTQVDLFEKSFIADSIEGSELDEELDIRTSKQMIKADYKHLVEDNGRPNRKSNSESVFNDRYLSHLIYYGLLGNDTHNLAMNVIFARMKRILLMRLEYPDKDFDFEAGIDYNDQLQGVFEVYLEHHPQDKTRIEHEISL